MLAHIPPPPFFYIIALSIQQFTFKIIINCAIPSTPTSIVCSHELIDLPVETRVFK